MIDVKVILFMLGGLGMFLYGMKLMSDSLEKAAGSRLRGILELFTKNKLSGILVGTIFTAIVQSSSATTVLVVSFVNARLMSLFQAAGVIYGANIGTTITSQLVAFKLSDVAPIFAFAGVVMLMFFKSPMVKKIGEVVIGFGILFLGLTMMSDSMSALKESPMISDALKSLTNPALAVLVGFIITAILQSSSATVGIVLLMASNGLLILPICFYLILGCNMGSCTSALMASIGGKKDAKRAAMIHFLFNIIGSVVICIILLFAIDPIEAAINSMSGGDIGRSVANAHTIFKVFEVLILLPFSNQIVKLTYLIVRGEDKKAERAELKYISDQTVISSTAAIPQAVQEINRMGVIAKENLQLAMEALVDGKKEHVDKVFTVEKSIDYLNSEITNYLVKANQLNLPISDKKLLAGLFHVVSDIERIGDHAENIAEDALAKEEHGLSFSEEGYRELKDMFGLVIEILDLSLEMFTKRSKEHLNKILDLENRIDAMEKQYQNNHIERLNQNQCSAQAGMMFSDLVSNFERIGDHATNIAFSILEEDPEPNKGPKTH